MCRLFFAWVVLGSFAQAQVEAHFSLPKEKYVAGEPVLLEYTVRNTGAEPVTITSARPNSFCSGYKVRVNRTDVAEPAPCDFHVSVDCESSSRTLNPGESVTEQFIVNDRDHMRTPGTYHISAIRTLETSLDADIRTLSSGPKVKTSAEFDVRIAEGDAEQVRSILLPYFADLSSEWHDTATQVAEKLSSAEVEDLVLQLYENPRTKDIAIRALAAANTPATRKQLADLACGGTPDNSSAAYVLGESGDRSYWPLLRELSFGQPSEQASVFISAAARLGGDEAVPWLRDLLRSSDPKTRSAAVYPLALTASRQAVPVLIDMLGDSEEDIQTDAEVALVWLTHRTFNPKQIAPSDTAAAHAAWIRWWARNRESASIYKPGEYCGNAAPLE